MKKITAPFSTAARLMWAGITEIGLTKTNVVVTDLQPNAQHECDFVELKNEKTGETYTTGEMVFSEKPDVGEKYVKLTRGINFYGYRRKILS